MPIPRPIVSYNGVQLAHRYSSGPIDLTSSIVTFLRITTTLSELKVTIENRLS
jgi:hypothetical protein